MWFKSDMNLFLGDITNSKHNDHLAVSDTIHKEVNFVIIVA